jgi:hypothetical protein
MNTKELQAFGFGLLSTPEAQLRKHKRKRTKGTAVSGEPKLTHPAFTPLISVPEASPSGNKTGVRTARRRTSPKKKKEKKKLTKTNLSTKPDNVTTAKRMRATAKNTPASTRTAATAAKAKRELIPPPPNVSTPATTDAGEPGGLPEAPPANAPPTVIDLYAKLALQHAVATIAPDADKPRELDEFARQRHLYSMVATATLATSTLTGVPDPRKPPQTRAPRLTINTSLAYKTVFDSQLEADVFFSTVDNGIIGAGEFGHTYMRPMLTDPRAHPFYTERRVPKYGPRVYGTDWVFNHLEHDHDTVARDIGQRYPNAARHLRQLVHDGGHLSWSSRDNVIYQHYRAALGQTYLHYVNVVHKSGLALRALMKQQATAHDFEDMALATISRQKIIKRVKYTRTEGALLYFATLQTELTYLEKAGMRLDSFSELELCGHILETFEAAHPVFADNIKTLRTEVKHKRFTISLWSIRAYLIKCEKSNGLKIDKKPPARANLVGAGPGPSSANPGNYPRALVQRAVAYANMRFTARWPDKPSRRCANCNPAWLQSVGRSYTPHDTATCPITLARCKNGAVDAATICPGHPDGCHSKSACKHGGKSRKQQQRRTARAKRATKAAAPKTAAPTRATLPTAAGTPGATPTTGAPPTTTQQLAQLQAFLAIPEDKRAAMMTAFGK